MKIGKYHFLFLGLFVFLIVLFFSANGSAKYENVNSFDGEMSLYKSSTCGCCGLYSKYYKSEGNENMTVKALSVEELENFKNSNEIYLDLRSCHTMIVGDYFVEGHVPLEAVEKLLRESPDVLGIAMPGMPVGSPGMPGRKNADFIVYSVNNDGSYQEFVRL